MDKKILNQTYFQRRQMHVRCWTSPICHYHCRSVGLRLDRQIMFTKDFQIIEQKMLPRNMRESVVGIEKVVCQSSLLSHFHRNTNILLDVP